MGIGEHVGDGEIRGDVERDEAGEGERHEQAFDERGGPGDRHQRVVVARRAPQRHHRAHERERAGEHESEMGELGDHFVPCPCHTPCFFRPSTTSRGM